MRFMLLIKSDAETEAGRTDGTGLREGLRAYGQTLRASGVLRAAARLKPSSDGARIRIRGGQADVIEGPFGEPSELVAGYWVVAVPSKQAAIELASRAPIVDGEIELREVFELDDFPVDPAEQPGGWRDQERELRESNPQHSAASGKRFIGFVMADEASEAGTLPNDTELAAMGEYTEQGIRDGIYIDGDGLKSSASGAKVLFQAGSRRVVDGPFTEAKELVAGYGVMQIASKREAIEWSTRMPVSDGMLELRELVHED
jgi:hypothetical protein